MTDFDYPPSRTYTFGAALEQAEQRLEDAEGRVDELEAQATDDDRDDPTDDALADAHQERQSAENARDALGWAVREFGETAEITIQGFTAKTRSEVHDTLNRTRVGHVGANKIGDWLVAAGVEEAPFIEPGDDVAAKAEIVEQLPPAFTDWIDEELEELNDLSAGN